MAANPLQPGIFFFGRPLSLSGKSRFVFPITTLYKKSGAERAKFFALGIAKTAYIL